MSNNRHKRLNEFCDPLMQYRSSEISALDDTLECDANRGKKTMNLLNITDISSALTSLSIKNSQSAVPGLQIMDEEYSACTSSTSNYSSGSANKPQEDLMNFSFVQSNNSFEGDKENSKEQSNKTPAQFDHLFNLNERLEECTSLSSDGETIKASSCDSSVKSIVRSSKEGPQSDHLLNLKKSSTTNITISSDSGTIKLSSCNSSTQNVRTTNIKENQINKGLIEMHREDKLTCGYFSSPIEFSQNNEEMLSMMEEPDMWDALIALEEVLSPFDGGETKSQEPSQILNRLSEKFKQTPTRFTEKLVSIIEESMITESPSKTHPRNSSGVSLDRMSGEFRKMCKFIADESMPDWAPSLMNMTTLNKTETPELENNKNNDNAGTPKTTLRNIQESPRTPFTPKAFKSFVTPKNNSRNQTPINRFTPSADKSFEYWENVCNIMCQNQGSAKKNVEKTVTVPETSKLSMDEMLTICERQMASLDDSTIDIRNSDPYRNTNSELKLKALQAPRSKSVSEIDSNKKETTKLEATKRRVMVDNEQKNIDGKNQQLKFYNNFDTLKKAKDLESNENDDNFDTLKKAKDLESNENDDSCAELLKIDSDSDNSTCKESEDSYQLSTRNRRSRLHRNEVNKNMCVADDSEDSFKSLMKNQRSSVHQKKKPVEKFKADYERLPFSPPPQVFQEKLNTENFYQNEDDQDCSLLIELAKRRQRCLETAKLMLEIDKEDPSSGDEDKTCLETLYKLGTQDETFTDFEEDKKFINTLNHCFEYKNYIRDKSKPIKNMLQKYESPEILKKRATAVMMSKQLVDKPKFLNSNTKNSKISSVSKQHSLDPKNALKSLQSRTLTPSKKPLLKALSTSEKKIVGGMQAKVTPRVTKKPLLTSKMLQSKSTSKLNEKSSLSELPHMKITSRSVTKEVSKINPEVKTISLQSQRQSKNVPPKLAANTNIIKTSKVMSKPMLKQRTPCSDKRPVLQNMVISSNESPVLRERNENITPEMQPQKRRLFVTPGRSPSVLVERKKPSSYFGDGAAKRTTPQRDYNNIPSPLSLYIKGTDAQLVQNAQTRTNDRLLTPVSNQCSGEGPKLKFNLASKENTSPTSHGAENIVLPTVRYQSAKKVCLTNDESPYMSLQSLTPNSRTKKLLEPVESTVVVRHEGRIVNYNPKLNLEPDMSIRTQHIAEKSSITRRKQM